MEVDDVIVEVDDVVEDKDTVETSGTGGGDTTGDIVAVDTAVVAITTGEETTPTRDGDGEAISGDDGAVVGNTDDVITDDIIGN